MLLSGTKLAEKIKKQIAREIKKTGLKPGLASILVGTDPASKIYIALKERAAREVGINFFKFTLQETSRLRSKNIVELIQKLNSDPKVHGILVQLPLPKGFYTDRIIAAIDPQKDVDGFHPENLKFLKAGKPRFIPPTHAGILALIDESRIMNHKSRKLRVHAVILANSKIFAEPLKLLLEQNGIKTQIIYNKLPITNYQLPATRNAHIVIVAKGKPNFLKVSMIKNDAIVIDVGTNRVHGKVVGDVDFKAVSKKAGAITPVPGGVGPMTVAMLLANTLAAAKKLN